MKDQNPLSDMHSLQQLRDELKLQAHLFKGEVAEQWKKLEKEVMLVMQTQSAPVKEAAIESAKEVKDASKQILKTLKQGYENIKRNLQ